MKKKPIIIDILIEARRDLAEVLEEMGAVAMHLREAMDAGENGNASFAAACVDDAQQAVDNAMAELAKIRDKAGRWAVWAESEIECEECEGTGKRAFAANCGEYTPCVDCGGTGKVSRQNAEL